ncbi:MAG: glutamate synthase subunit alpha, partial [Microbacteriaceae bacterium]
MVATLRGTGGHDIIDTALAALRNLEHRGAIGSDAGTGDGAGILTQIPDAFLRAVSGFALPPLGRYAVGNAFLPDERAERDQIKAEIEAIAKEESLSILGWREVPVRPDEIGMLARAAMPAIEQVYIESTRTTDGGDSAGGTLLERQVYRLRKRV